MEIKKYDKFLEELNSNWEGISYPDHKKEVLQRTTELSKEEFLEILNNNCKNFSFDNTLLWRSKHKKFDLELFKPGLRNAQAITFTDFFDKIEDDEEYPVARKKSLIGGTNKEICSKLVGLDMYLVIPFDNSEIVFADVFDLWGMGDKLPNSNIRNLVNGVPVSKDNFTKVSYTKNFTYLDKGRGDKGCEFFTSSKCLMVHDDSIDWLKNELKKGN